MVKKEAVPKPSAKLRLAILRKEATHLKITPAGFLRQSDSTLVLKSLQNWLKEQACSVFLKAVEEVEMFCGPKFKRNVRSKYHRAGHANSSVFISDEKEKLKRPSARSG